MHVQVLPLPSFFFSSCYFFLFFLIISSTMASSSFSSISTVSQEEFNLFHKMDRRLFARLVFDLQRDPAESNRLMALWLWLEGALLYRNLDLVSNSLLPLPDNLLAAFADESLAVLNCVEADGFPAPPPEDIPLFRRLIGDCATPEFFRHNRMLVIRGVTEVIDRVCARAFGDITARAAEIAGVAMMIGATPPSPYLAATAAIALPSFVRVLPHHHKHPYYHYYLHEDHGGAAGPGYNFLPRSEFGISTPDYVDDDAAAVQRRSSLIDQVQLVNEIIRGLDFNDDDHVINRGEDYYDINQVVPADERTIFLTFSKGYPISEAEVRDFFTSKYGDELIDGIYMQEVRSADEQSLYARLVVCSASAVGEVLEGNRKVKFSINGKHVWARKYVRKTTSLIKSPPKSLEEQSQPRSPSAETQF